MNSTPDFARWLQFGFGRAILHLADHDATPYRDIILNACLHNLALYRQFEGSRAEYMFDLISRTPDFDFYCDALLDELIKFQPMDREQFRENYYDIQQVYDLVALIAHSGSQKARDSLYQQFEAHPAFGDFIAAQAIIQAEGLDGFLKIAKRLNILVQEYDTEFEVDESGSYDLRSDLLDPLEETLGESEYLSLIAKLRLENPNLTPLLDALEQDWNKWHASSTRSPKPPDLHSYDEIYLLLQKPILSGRYGRIGEWRKTASVEDLQRAALDLLKAQDDEIILNYLFIFGKRTFPLHPQLLIPLANRNHELMGSSVIRALQDFAHPAIRKFALESIEHSKLLADVVGLFKNNFEQGDWERIKQLTERNLNEEDIHSMGIDIFNVFAAHPSIDAAPALFNLYERNHCAMCRERVVEHLHEIDQIPEWMREECRYDSNIDLRKEIINGFKE